MKFGGMVLIKELYEVYDKDIICETALYREVSGKVVTQGFFNVTIK